jgi:uncharacterized C2H2 Zn-finger protein
LLFPRKETRIISLGDNEPHLEYISILMTTKESQEQVSCPYCESKFKDRVELSKHIDGVHTGLGLLEGDTRRW